MLRGGLPPSLHEEPNRGWPRRLSRTSRQLKTQKVKIQSDLGSKPSSHTTLINYVNLGKRNNFSELFINSTL